MTPCIPTGHSIAFLMAYTVRRQEFCTSFQLDAGGLSLREKSLAE